MGKQAKSLKGIRALKKKEPKLIQGIKKTMLIHGNKTSEPVLKFLKDIRSLRRDRSVYYSRKHQIQPFQDKKNLQEYCHKADTSLFSFGSHSKKRPNNIVIGRTYDGKVLDMVELGIMSNTSIPELNQSPNLSYHVRPFIIFQGDVWETDEQFKKTRNLFNDFFFENDKIQGIQIDNFLKVIVSFTVMEDKRILMRTFESKIEGSDILEDEGKIVLEELGPNIEFVLRRSSFADADMWRKATHVPKPKKKKERKNIKSDKIGNLKGKLYVDRQDLKRMPSKRRKLISKPLKTEGKVQQLQEKVENEFDV